MQLFYIPEISRGDTHFTFSKAESKHIVTVLRKKVGQALEVTNGNGLIVKGTLIVADPKKSILEIAWRQQEPAPKRKLHMAVAPTKMNDRFEWFLEKATEIGIHEITPIICARSERRVIKKPRLEKIIQSAMKQSLRYYLPKLNDAISFSEFVQKNSGQFCYIAHCEEREKEVLSSKAIDKDCTIAIGPEGDFTPEEIDMALQTGYCAISLGAKRLRTETAALVACTIVNIQEN